MDPAFNYDTISAAIHNQFSIHPNVVLEETAANTLKNTFNSNGSSQANTSCPTVNTTAPSSIRHSRSGSSYYDYNCQHETEIFKALESLSLTSNNSDSNDTNNNVNYTYHSHRLRSHTSSFTTLPLLASKTQTSTPHAETTDKTPKYNQTKCYLSSNKNHLDEEMVDVGSTENDPDCELDDTLPLHHISTIHHQILQQEKAEEELVKRNKL